MIRESISKKVDTFSYVFYISHWEIPYPDEVYELQKYDNEKNHETSHIDD